MATAVQIAEAAAHAGWRGKDLTTAVAVALAESRGNSNANRVTSREDSRGLWQINVRAHPQYASVNLYDDATNAKAAYAIWQRDGWGPWSTHNTGAYLLFWPTALGVVQSAGVKRIVTDPAAAAQGISNTITDAVPVAGDMIGAVQSAVGLVIKAGAWVGDRHNWARVAQVYIGGALVVGGVLLVTRQVWLPVASAAAKTAVTKGRA